MSKINFIDFREEDSAHREFTVEVSHGRRDLVNLNMDSSIEPNLGLGCRKVEKSSF